MNHCDWYTLILLLLLHLVRSSCWEWSKFEEYIHQENNQVQYTLSHNSYDHILAASVSTVLDNPDKLTHHSNSRSRSYTDPDQSKFGLKDTWLGQGKHQDRVHSKDNNNLNDNQIGSSDKNSTVFDRLPISLTSESLSFVRQENLSKSFLSDVFSNEITSTSIRKESAHQQVDWYLNILSKIACLRQGKGGIFLYHVRKAAGTTIRDLLEHTCELWSVKLFEVEGLSLDPHFLNFHYSKSPMKNPSSLRTEHSSDLLSVISFRNPIDRIISMYWYEYVGWWDGIQKLTNKCKPLSEWIDVWSDAHAWKQDFMKKNPKNVYVEIENYYIKLLINWDNRKENGRAVTIKDLEQAKAILDTFDMILIMEWMNDASQINTLSELFPGRSNIAAKHILKGDQKAKKRLYSRLSPDEDVQRQRLIRMNAYDVQLWEYAKSVAAKRFRRFSNHLNTGQLAEVNSNQHCDSKIKIKSLNNNELDKQLGIHRPVGHKYP